MEGESAIEFFPLGVVVLRNFIDDETQRRLYLSELYNPGIDSPARARVEGKDTSRSILYRGVSALLLSQWQNVFTQQSNIPEPKDLLALVNEAFVAARKKKDSLGDEKPEEDDPQLRLPTEIRIDNLYAQLYPAEGKAIPHIDAYLSWVASVTIGGSCDFQFGKDAKNLTNSVKVNSGDVVLINGGKIYHSVPKIYADCAPSWWLAGEVPTHGFARCNIQCRDTSATDPATPESWKQLYV